MLANSLLQKSLQAQSAADRENDLGNGDGDEARTEPKKHTPGTSSEETKSLIQNAEDLTLPEFRPLEASRTCLDEGAEEADEPE